MAYQTRPWDDGSKGFSTLFWEVIAANQVLHISIMAIGFYWWAP
jgi:hypothetical protein